MSDDQVLVQIEHRVAKTSLHRHLLEITDRGCFWKCDGCSRRMLCAKARWRCSEGCKFDICRACCEADIKEVANEETVDKEGIKESARQVPAGMFGLPETRNEAFQYLDDAFAARAKARSESIKRRATWFASPVLLQDLQRIGLLGNGGFASVELCRHVPTGETYALKTLSKGYVQKSGMKDAVMNEKKVMQLMCSFFIVRLYATFNDGGHLHFLIEPALGGELYSTYNRKKLYGDVACNKFHIACVVLGLEHMHERKIIYRGAVPENIVLDESGSAKLCDFGLSKVLVEGLTRTMCGTPDYFAPEVIGSTGYNHSVDWWCVGVLMFELLCGHPPFESPTPMQIYQKVVKGIKKVKFPRKYQGSTQDLVEGLLHQEPAKRLPMLPGGIDNLKSHTWYFDFRWTALSNRTMTPPYQPTVDGPADISNFNAQKEDGPPQIQYEDDHTGWDEGFETGSLETTIVLNPQNPDGQGNKRGSARASSARASAARASSASKKSIKPQRKSAGASSASKKSIKPERTSTKSSQ